MGGSEAEFPGRRFFLSDAIVLVAAVALMLTSNRVVHWFWSWGDRIASYGPVQTRRMSWSLAFIELNLVLLAFAVGRRRGRESLAGGAPGLHVHLAIAAALAIRLVVWGVTALGVSAPREWFALGQSRFRWTVVVMNYLYNGFWHDAVVAVGTSWLALAVVRKWRPERSWDDRLGRCLGLAVPALYLASLLGLYFF